jgi:hypothetical protein
MDDKEKHKSFAISDKVNVSAQVDTHIGTYCGT